MMCLLSIVLVTIMIISTAHAQAAPHTTLLTATDLPPLQQQHGRVLVIITGVWEKRPAGDVKWRLLHTLLNNYVQLCESGFEVHVVLSTYVHETLAYRQDVTAFDIHPEELFVTEWQC